MIEMPPQRDPSFVGIIGVGREDITPPSGIYARNWGAAEHDTAEGIHRPHTATAITFQAETGGKLILVSLDLGWWRTVEDEESVRGALLRELGLDPAEIIVHLTHTHAGPSLCREDSDKPGGSLIRPYLDQVAASVVRCSNLALESARPATLTWRYGKCDLATNRDLPDPLADRYLSGFNPNGIADDTLLAGRITSESGEVLATIVNYACHPTTLGPGNRMISPDYVGAMREVVETATGGAPCLFLLGAAGELAPAEQYSADPQLADSHGRRLGYAALANLEAMRPPLTELIFTGAIESGSPLAMWTLTPTLTAPTELAADIVEVELPLKEWPSLAELQAQMAECADRAIAERLERKLRVRRIVGDGKTTRRSVWVWQLGDSVLVGHGNEAYSDLQTVLRARFPDHAVAVANLVNGACGYLPTEDLFDHDVYPVWQTPFAQGSLEKLISKSIEAVSELTGWEVI